MAVLKWIGVVVVALALLLVLAGQLGFLKGHPPRDLGVQEGRLKRPSFTDNSVSSQADLWPGHPQREHARIAPLPVSGSGPATLARIKTLVEATSGARVIEARPDYLYVQFTTRMLKFVDDAEFWFDAQAGVVHVRSSSRVGRKDFGVNRARIEAIRAQLAN